MPIIVNLNVSQTFIDPAVVISMSQVREHLEMIAEMMEERHAQENKRGEDEKEGNEEEGSEGEVEEGERSEDGGSSGDDIKRFKVEQTKLSKQSLKWIQTHIPYHYTRACSIV